MSSPFVIVLTDAEDRTLAARLASARRLARGDFIDAQNPRTGLLAGAINKNYDLYAIDAPGSIAAEPATAYRPYGQAAATAAVLPPLQRSAGTLVGLLQNPTRGLPDAQTDFAVKPYSPGLSLTYVGQPSLAVGSTQFGTFIGGGASLYFSDLLGNHNLVTGLNVQGSFKDVNALVGYQNLTHRLNWGAIAQQTPYLTGSFVQGTGTVDGQPALVDQQLLDRQTNRDVYGLLSYPFSQVQRIEFQAGFSNITFDRELRTRAFSFNTGEQILDDEVDLPAGRALNLGVATAALVYDNSLSGADRLHLAARRRPLSLRGVAHCRVNQLRRGARRLPQIFSAGSSLHLRHPDPPLRPLRPGRRKQQAATAVPGLSRLGARL